MKIALVIDDLNSGGAQRQLCILGRLLTEEGHSVELYKFHPNDFFRPLLKEYGVTVRDIYSHSYIGRALKLRAAIRSSECHVAIAFMSAPSFFLELAGLPSRRFAVIVSERSGRVGGISLRDRLFLESHRMADAVVTNSHSMKNIAVTAVPALRDKIHVIVNCVDTDYFHMSDRERHLGPIRFVVPARISAAKNAIGLSSAIRVVRQSRPELDFVVEWYGDNYFKAGKPTSASRSFLEVEKHIRTHGLQDVFNLKPPVKDLRPIYHGADALLLPSFFEGCSNAICEAFACGLPVVTSNVCDNSLIVNDGVNGMLFDPTDPSSIADAIIQFCELDREVHRKMGQSGREHAETQFSQDRFLDEYLSLIRRVCRVRGLS